MGCPIYAASTSFLAFPLRSVSITRLQSSKPRFIRCINECYSSPLGKAVVHSNLVSHCSSAASRNAAVSTTSGQPKQWWSAGNHRQDTMGDLVPVTASNSGVLTVPDRKQQLVDYEKRLADAKKLEEKLNKIQEEVPTRIYNVAGSCAGAGSGDFHYYRQIRRAEQDRLRRMDAEDKKEQETKEFEEKLRKRQAAAEERTAKNRNKRQKQKEKKKAAKVSKGGEGEGGDGNGAAGVGGGKGSESSDEGQPELD